ncbi:FeoC-like transcriptional regulator [Psychromonas algicola]|uniref:FeoC-like transcriptional regulator n=1 Tax=Psychromonas algicola TaxID=2555642 RepID=UPI001067AD31|nr:FeoC-like transcriptional regulator [Psychromonas sp. RZ5]TEW51319.1 hypothetical protein E2R67_07970 [Psychromonas sp. RZ5]
MILKALSDYIQTQQRVEEKDLLKHFRLKQSGLAPMIEILIAHGHIQKTINNRGENLPAQVFYSWKEVKVIPMTAVI